MKINFFESGAGFIRRAFEFVARPSHSRTLGLVLMLVLVAAVSLTVYVAQQQQELRQRAQENGENCSGTLSLLNRTGSGTPPFRITNSPRSINNPMQLADVSTNNNDYTYYNLLPGTYNFAVYDAKGEQLYINTTFIAVCSSNNPSQTTPSTKKTVGQSCTQEEKCETGLTCEYYEELGYSQCTPPITTPTSIPTLVPVATIWIENPQANWDTEGVIRRQVTEAVAKTFYLGGWSQVTGPLTPDIVAADRPLGTKSRFGTNIDSSGISTTVHPSSTISYITPTLAPTTICTTNADCPAPPSCYSGAQKNCLNGGTANATCLYTSSSGTCQITSQANTCASVCVATPTLTPTQAPAAVVSLKDKGDADGNGLINEADYEIWKGEFISGTGTRADFNTSGAPVDILDFNIWYEFKGT